MRSVYAELLRIQGKTNAEIARLLYTSEQKVREWLDQPVEPATVPIEVNSIDVKAA